MFILESILILAATGVALHYLTKPRSREELVPVRIQSRRR